MAIAMAGRKSGEPVPTGGADPFPAGSVVDRSRPIGEQVYALLRHAIINWRLRPGDAIPEALVTKRFEVSRSPLREAVRQLSADGLVIIRPQAGTYVSPLDRPAWEEGRAIRRALEVEGVSRAAVRVAERDLEALELLMVQQERAVAAEDFERLLDLDDRFHQSICELSDFPRLWRMIDGAKAQVDRTRYLALPAMGRADATLAEHRAILDALAARDPDLAVARLTQHLDSSDAAMAHLFEEGMMPAAE